MTRSDLKGRAKEYRSRYNDVDYADELVDFTIAQLNDVLDRVLRTLYLCQPDRCDHCAKKIRIIEGFKIR